MSEFWEYSDCTKEELEAIRDVMLMELAACEYEVKRAKELTRPRLMLDYLVYIEKFKRDIVVVNQAIIFGGWDVE
jgi:hypothetical protein